MASGDPGEQPIIPWEQPIIPGEHPIRFPRPPWRGFFFAFLLVVPHPPHQSLPPNLFDEVNGGLADGYEVLLARWLNNRTAAVEYLTAFRLAGQCTPQRPALVSVPDR